MPHIGPGPFVALLLLVALPASAASHPTTALGSAIALEYAVQHDVMRPGESVTLLACLANHNPESRRDVQPGDTFAFEFGNGTLDECAPMSAISACGVLDETDGDCAMSGKVLVPEIRSAP